MAPGRQVRGWGHGRAPPGQGWRRQWMLDAQSSENRNLRNTNPPTHPLFFNTARYGVPRICFVNKMDRMGANFYRTRDMVRLLRPCGSVAWVGFDAAVARAFLGVGVTATWHEIARARPFIKPPLHAALSADRLQPGCQPAGHPAAHRRGGGVQGHG